MAENGASETEVGFTAVAGDVDVWVWDADDEDIAATELLATHKAMAILTKSMSTPDYNDEKLKIIFLFRLAKMIRTLAAKLLRCTRALHSIL